MSSIPGYRCLATLASAVLLSMTPVYAAGGSGSVTALAIDPQTPTTIYAATYGGGLFKSTDAGVTWSVVGPPGIANVLSLVIDPQTPTTVYVGDDRGAVHKSADGGATWSRAVMDLRSLGICWPCGGVLALALDSHAPATVFSGTDVIRAQNEDGLSYTLSGNVYKSADGGASFGAVGTERPIVSFSSLAIAAGYPGEAPTLYAGHTVSPWWVNSSNATTSGGVLKSTDGGASWTSTLTSIGNVRTIAVDPLTPTTVYASGGTLFKSTDGGESWHASLAGGVADVVAVDPVNPSVVYAGGAGIYKSTDAGATWNGLFAGIGDVSAIAIDPLNPSAVYAGTSTGVYKTTDGGMSWHATGLVDYSNALLLDIPRSIHGGTYAAGFVFVPLVPDDGAAFISLWSSNPTVASVPREVTVWGGFHDTGFTIYTSLVTANTPVEIFAAFDGKVVSVATVVTASVFTDFRAVPTSVSGGMQSTGTVTLGTAAPPTGAVIALASSVPTVAAVPTSVTVAAGATNATFAISTSAVATQTPVTIFATYGDVTINTILTVSPPTLPSVTLVPTTVAAGATSSGTVTLSSPAPPGGAAVAVSSSNPAVAQVPASVTVPAGGSGATFTVSTSSVLTATSVTISATYGGVTKSAALTVIPITTLLAVTLNPASVPGGSPSVGTVTLSAAAPPGGVVIGLANSDAAVAAIPASVTVPAGGMSATFTISTNPVAAAASITISASYDGVARSAVLIVTPLTVYSLSLNPTSVTAGDSSIGTVTLSGPAPAGGVAIALSSSDAAIAVVPTDVTIAAGATSAAFTVTTPACASGTVTISAAYSGATRSAALTVIKTSDTVAIKTADYVRRKQLLRVEATSTTSTATLSVYETSSGAFIGMLTRYDGSRYRGELRWPVNPQNITVRSSHCGWAERDVVLK